MRMAPVTRALSLLLLITFTAGVYCQGISRNADYYPLNGIANGNGEKGLFPSVFNLAADADIVVNATCGETGPEVYCKLVEHVFMRAPQCGVCDANAEDPTLRHPITNAIDGTNSWWQSPTLQNGRKYEWITITIDLKQVYQVAYVIVKTAISPRPGDWILERSIDGVHFLPWQYYAISDAECLRRYGIQAREGKPTYRSDSEVICTSFYSKLNPLEDGEIHTSLVNGRPGASLPTEELLDFTKARYVRLRLQKIRTLNEDLMSLSSTGVRNASTSSQSANSPELDRSLYRRLFYSIKDISIGGQCVCYGHAASCLPDVSFGRSKCKCEHNTCGESCDRCCPLFNQKPWRAGTSADGAVCEACQCYGHAERCYYDEKIALQRKSLNVNNVYEGGGVCINCTHFTTGINCEQCLDGYFRPLGIARDSPQSCVLCQCNPVGSIGHCTKDDSQITEGFNPGQCFCKEGFSGLKCDKCAKGFGNFPKCEPCPCSTAGTSNAQCKSPCQCKVNVMGDSCNQCKPGYFDLREDNPEGCNQCFCFGHSGQCFSSDLGIDRINSKHGWLVTDLLGRRVVTPYMDNDRLYVANDDMADYETYFWLAPEEFGGKKLVIYGQILKFKVSWIKARGDTGGKATKGPDIILEGNGMKIGLGDRAYRDSNASVTLRLTEKNWYNIPDSVQDIVRKRRTEYKGELVSRSQFMAILNDLQRLMIRAKFHTDQIEGVLHDVELEVGSENSLSRERAHGIERCVCPPGYVGLSCEDCDFGYIRINKSRGQFDCLPCNCNGHAATCDPDLGTCSTCLHNTIGQHCEHCALGYHGNARSGRPDSCKKCRCPLEISSNNFSPTCQSVNDSDYICDQCPPGYEGNHCERCADGFFGNPLIPGNFCQPCDCNNNHEIGVTDWCDRLTGHCLKCKNHVTGFHCEQCQLGYYGNAVEGTCKACKCNPYGSLNNQCDLATGQCRCKDRFTGKQCDRCKNGYGNIAAGCRECNCDPTGSVTAEVCSHETGQCECKAGIGGLQCNQCLEDHYGYSNDGCQGCACNPSGSRGRSCDIVTGQCQCKPNVIGRTCDQCQVGYWNFQSGKGCLPCQCDELGSMNGTCDANGFCYCQPGIGGQSCDRCLPGFYGFSVTGCKECEPCNKPGHICDPDTGRCVCPPYTQGNECQFCADGSWNYDPVKGCKPCHCHGQGSLSVKCDRVSGQCPCKEGYEGQHCDRCQFGYYGLPHCKKCDCNPAGTESQACNSQNICQCNSDGQCPCKANVSGKKCAVCKEATFGLQQENSEGCTPCFCFTRARHCTQADYIWTQVRGEENGRILMITYDHPLRPPNALGANQFPVNTQEICYINLALPGQREVKFKPGETRLNVTNNLRIIPGVQGDVMIGVSQMFDTPLYWRLPDTFLRDKILSYNGYLRFTIANEGGATLFPNKILATYPLVQIQGNWKVILEYYPTKINPSGHYEVRLHESLWHTKNNPQARVSRELMMVALQNIQHILIRATDSMDRTKVELKELSLDVAVSAPARGSALNLARGIEACQCPTEYNGTSCQDPSFGYYRRYKVDHVSSTIIIDLVGESHPCQCSGRSNICDKESGYCRNCRENTAGARCEICVAGYYGNPDREPCKPCQCPTAEKNFADSCEAFKNGSFKCFCRKGYRGGNCERCDYGFYGNPLAMDGYCQPCNCDPNGSVSDECDEVTGQCNCKPGISGRDCTFCAPRHVVSPSGCSSCEGECTGILFQEIDELHRSVSKLTISNYVPLPWTGLIQYENATIIEESFLEEKQTEKENIERLLGIPSMLPLAQITRQRITESEFQVRKLVEDSANLHPHAGLLEKDVMNIYETVEGLIVYLKNYAIGETTSVNINRAISEAENHLNYILSMNSTIRDLNSQRELERSKKLLGSIQNLFSNNQDGSDVQVKLNRLQLKIEDILQHLNKSLNNSSSALQITNEGNRTLWRIREHIRGISEESTKAETDLNTARKQNALASRSLQHIHEFFKSIRNAYGSLNNKMIQCEKKVRELNRLDSAYKEEFVIPAQMHANKLWQQAQQLFSQFNATKDVADLPLRAANAYKSIVDALVKAREAAEDAGQAADTAYTEAYPDDLELSLVERAKLSRDGSRELLQQSQGLKVTVAELSRRLKTDKTLLENVEKMLNAAKNSNDDARFQMKKIVGVRDRVKTAVEKSTNAFTKSIAISRRVGNVTSLIDSELRVKLLAVQSGRMITYGNTPKQIEESRKNVKSCESKISIISKKNYDLRTLNSSLAFKVEELKKKIMRAKQAASSIHVSLSGKTGTCFRTFSLPLQPSSMSSIVLTYALSNKDRNSLLFYLPATKKHPNDLETDFLAIEMVDRKIKFLWNVGGGVQSVTHPLPLLPSPDDMLDDSRWYKIEAERNGNIGTLIVRPVKPEDSFHKEDVKVSAAGPAKYTKLDLTSNDLLYIGGLPITRSSEIKSTRFSGCLHQVWFDGHPVGLWNFNTSTRCSACIEGAQEAKDESSFYFNGRGYAELSQIPRYDPRQYSITFSFKTLDENALLFLAINESVGQYISLELREGFLRYEVRYESNHELALQSRYKYNTGVWVKVEASRVLLRGVETALLKVAEDEELSAAPFHSKIPDLDLEEARLYVGGLPPDVHISTFLMPTLPGSYLGCMKDLQVVAFGLNPLQGSFYGVEASCPAEGEKVVALQGQGFVQLRIPAPKKDFSLGFSFRTESPDGIILYVTPVPTEFNDEPNVSAEEDQFLVSMALKGDREADIISFALRHGKLEARFKSATSETIAIISTSSFNDGQFHNAVAIRSGKKIDVLVDDVSIGTGRLARVTSSSTGDHSYIHLGGIRSEYLAAATDFIGIQQAFIGCIADLMLNNELVSLREPVKHVGISIGRCGHVPQVRAIEERMQANENALSSCREVPQYTIEGRAVKFGDAANSHVIISANRKELQTSFNFTLDFRTHYPNGLFLYTSLKQKKVLNYFLVSLKNGRVSVSLSGRRKEEVISTNAVNDGHWHKVHIFKDKRKMTLIVDDHAPVRAKAPNRLQLDGQIFVGGLPDTNNQHIDFTVLEGFKGCIRNLNLNGRSYDLASGKNTIHRVGQCFAHVETGSYFPGDAYAVYSEDFRVGAMADIQLEFRTTESSGVLLSVSELKGSPSLSLFVEEGTVVFAVDMGDNHTFTVSQSFPSPFQICDNRWHSVKASYVENALTLKIDNLDEQYGFSSNGEVLQAKTRSPLFIGGLPDFVPQGTLRIRDNFKGCIRNVVIRGEIKDWTDMAKLNNVLLNACPVQ